MSLADGIAALNLEMPPRVPRTEYSADNHWELVKLATGIDVGPESSDKIKKRASHAFVKAWSYDVYWGTLIGGDIFGDLHTNMGHGIYAAGGGDYDDQIYCPFNDPEEVLNFDPWEAYGEQDKTKLVKRYENHYKELCNDHPDAVNTTGVYVTCISGLIDIFGWEMLLMAAGVDPIRFGELTNRYAGWMMQYFEAMD